MTQLFILALLLNSPAWAKINRRISSFRIEHNLKPPEPNNIPYKPTSSVSKDLQMTPFVHIFKSIFIGVDGRYSLPAGGIPYNYGPVAGVQLRTIVPTRIWIGPNMSVVKLSSADGFRIGAGLRISKVNINLELQKTSSQESNTSTV